MRKGRDPDMSYNTYSDAEIIFFGSDIDSFNEWDADDLVPPILLNSIKIKFPVPLSNFITNMKLPGDSISDAGLARFIHDSNALSH